jgi:hypothetical protein
MLAAWGGIQRRDAPRWSATWGVVMGGVGDVNAQIGDSDTGGTVTMGTVDSEVHGGNSR